MLKTLYRIGVGLLALGAAWYEALTGAKLTALVIVALGMIFIAICHLEDIKAELKTQPRK